MVAQIKRAVQSIGANIAEGWGRYHYKDRIRFLYQARGSLYEVKHFLRAARRLGFLSNCPESLLKELSEKLELEGVKINNAIASLYKAANLIK